VFVVTNSGYFEIGDSVGYCDVSGICRHVVGQKFTGAGGTCCIHLSYSNLKMAAAGSSETLVTFCRNTRHHVLADRDYQEFLCFTYRFCVVA
jgi:hypothetical protein